MADQFRDTRGSNYCNEAYASWNNANAVAPPEVRYDGDGLVDDHPSWGRSASEVFSGDARLHPSVAQLRTNNLLEAPVRTSDPSRDSSLVSEYTGGYSVASVVHSDDRSRAILDLARANKALNRV
jgi:hypothetical protein